MAREKFTDEELNSGIFRPDKTKHTPLQQKTPNIIVYTVNTKEDRKSNETIQDVNSNLAYAKKDGKRYFVKSNGGQLADPRGLYENDIYKRIGDQAVWRWREVSPKVFDLYLAYLRTANKSYYRNAARETF